MQDNAIYKFRESMSIGNLNRSPTAELKSCTLCQVSKYRQLTDRSVLHNYLSLLQYVAFAIKDMQEIYPIRQTDNTDPDSAFFDHGLA